MKALGVVVVVLVVLSLLVLATAVRIVKQYENGVLFLRAYCYLREDLRAFVIAKMSVIEISG